jgi:peptide-methionine (R)-S-oxide reductase
MSWIRVGGALVRRRPALVVSVFATGFGVGLLLTRTSTNQKPEENLDDRQRFFRSLTDADWKARLEPEAFEILRKGGTEPARTGPYWRKEAADSPDEIYLCVGCRTPLFKEDQKFRSSDGWPSFAQPLPGVVSEHKSWLGPRTEITCSVCDGHLGHVFSDGPKDMGGRRFCVNGHALDKVKVKAPE